MPDPAPENAQQDARRAAARRVLRARRAEPHPVAPRSRFWAIVAIVLALFACVVAMAAIILR